MSSNWNDWVQERVSRLERVSDMEADSPCGDDTCHHAVVERRQYVSTEKQFQSSKSHVVCRFLKDCPVRQVDNFGFLEDCPVRQVCDYIL
jgi:hypothetical protein